MQRFCGHPIGGCITWVALKMYTLIGLGFSLVPLVLLTWERWLPIYHTCAYIGVLFFGPWSSWLVRRILRVPRAPDDKSK